jgi:hypothetical protein
MRRLLFHEPEISNRSFELGVACDLLRVGEDIVVGSKEKIIKYFEQRWLLVLFAQ